MPAKEFNALPREVQWAVRNALNKVEARTLVNTYRNHGINAAVERGLWYNKNRSPMGRWNWQEYRRRKKAHRDAAQRLTA